MDAPNRLRQRAHQLRTRAGHQAAQRLDPLVDRRFHQRYYYDPGTWRETYWLGVNAQKCPLDLWVYQEILHETRPDLVIETGTCHGGSALYLASVFDLLGRGQVVTVDIEEVPGRPVHPRITYLHGSSTSPEMVAAVTERAAAAERVMVVLDSDHSEAHVLEELKRLASLVTPGCYLVVEDTNINGQPVQPWSGPGPGEALRRFLGGLAPGTFDVDHGREKFHLTFNPGGYLRRLG